MVPTMPTGRPAVDHDGPGARRVYRYPGCGCATRTRDRADLHKRLPVAGSGRRLHCPETTAGGPR